MLGNLEKGSAIEESGIDEELLSELSFLYDQGTRIIYSLVIHPDCTRDHRLIKYIWENRFKDTQYITEINGMSIGVKDFDAPSQEQFEVITNDAIEKLNAGNNILFHCHGGAGRTGAMLCAVYMKAHNHYDSEQAISRIRQTCSKNAVESQVQKDELKLFCANLKLKQDGLTINNTYENTLTSPPVIASGYEAITVAPLPEKPLAPFSTESIQKIKAIFGASLKKSEDKAKARADERANKKKK